MSKKMICSNAETPCGVNAENKLNKIRENLKIKIENVNSINAGDFSCLSQYLDEAVDDEILNMYIEKFKVNNRQVSVLSGKAITKADKAYSASIKPQLKNRIIDKLNADKSIYIKRIKALYHDYNKNENIVLSEEDVKDIISSHKDYINFGKRNEVKDEKNNSYSYKTNVYEDFKEVYTNERKESNIMARMLFNMVVNNEKSIDILRSNTDFLNTEVMILKQLDENSKNDYYIDLLPKGMFTTMINEAKVYSNEIDNKQSENEQNVDDKLQNAICELAETEVEIEEDEEIIDDDKALYVKEEYDEIQLAKMNKKERDKNFNGQYAFNFDVLEKE